jgi:hypothetical protein
MNVLNSVRARKQRAQVLFEICKFPEIDELLSVLAVEIAVELVREQTTSLEGALPRPVLSIAHILRSRRIERMLNRQTKQMTVNLPMYLCTGTNSPSTGNGTGTESYWQERDCRA